MSQGLILPPAIAARMQDESCAGCRFFHRERDGDTVCRRNPPTVSILLVPAPPPRVGVGPQPFSVFTPIRPEMWCGEWQRRHDA